MKRACAERKAFIPSSGSAPSNSLEDFHIALICQMFSKRQECGSLLQAFGVESMLCKLFTLGTNRFDHQGITDSHCDGQTPLISHFPDRNQSDKPSDDEIIIRLPESSSGLCLTTERSNPMYERFKLVLGTTAEHHNKVGWGMNIVSATSRSLATAA